MNRAENPPPIKQRITLTRDGIRKLGREAGAAVTLVATSAVALTALLAETELKSGRIKGFGPLERGRSREDAFRSLDGVVHLPYGSKALVVFEGVNGGEDIEAVVMDDADSRGEEDIRNRKFARAKMFWGRKVNQIKAGGKTQYPIDGESRSVKIEKTTIVIPELDATLTHFRRPKEPTPLTPPTA